MLVSVGVAGRQSEIRASVSGKDAVVRVDGVAHSDGNTDALVVARLADACRQLLHSSDELARIVLGLTMLPAECCNILRLAKEIFDATGAKEVWLAGDAVFAVVVQEHARADDPIARFDGPSRIPTERGLRACYCTRRNTLRPTDHRMESVMTKSDDANAATLARYRNRVRSL